MTLPLSGVRITEMGQLIAIPHAIKLLSDMGAEVVRIESCGRLENYRASSFYDNSVDGAFWNRCANFYEQNRNKLGVTLDLSLPAGREVLGDLVAVSDVFAENFTPRVVRNFGLTYEDLRRIRPDIIMVSSTGYGQTGPWAELGAIGYATEAASGLAHMTGYEDGPPVVPEIPYADYVAAENTVFAIMAALTHRARTGKGQRIDVSQTETVSSTIPEALLDYTVNGRIQPRHGNADSAMSPHGNYRCSGLGNWIAIAVATDAQWRSLCAGLNQPAWAEDTRFADTLSRWRHRRDLDALVDDATGSWDPIKLMHALQGRGVPAGAVLNGKELLADAHLRDRGFYETMAHHPSTEMPPLPYPSRPWRFSKTPGTARTPAPTMGEHNRLVLSGLLGRTERELELLEQEGVIGYAPIRPSAPSVVSLEDQKSLGRILDYDADFRQRAQPQ